jgi:uncharacterized membrane protein
MFPSIPGWDAVHPLIVHFPIALLLVAPVLIILGLFLPKQSRGLLIGALVMIVLGTIGIYFAVATGEAAGELAERTPGIAGVLERHEELAETARTIFTALTVVFASILFAPSFFKKRLSRKTVTIVSLVFLVFYGGGAILLANVAHQGGLLVHHYGVRAMMGSANQSAPANKSESKHETEREKEK